MAFENNNIFTLIDNWVYDKCAYNSERDDDDNDDDQFILV